MTSKLKNRIAKKVVDYLRDNSDLQELREWLAPIVWDIEDENDAPAESLAYGIERALSEFDHGHLTRVELRRSLESLIPEYSTSGNVVGSQTVSEPERKPIGRSSEPQP